MIVVSKCKIKKQINRKLIKNENTARTAVLKCFPDNHRLIENPQHTLKVDSIEMKSAHIDAGVKKA
jgi:hypothetical protein